MESELECFVQVREAQKLKRAYLEERRRRKEEAELEQCQPAPMTKKSRELAQKVAARRGSFFEREAKFSADRARKLERMKRHKVRTTTGATTSIISLSSRRTDWTWTHAGLLDVMFCRFRRRRRRRRQR